MRRIPIDHQLALHLSFWHELTNPQIAKILGIPVGTVAGRLRLGKERLHTKIDEFNADPALVESTRGMLKWYDDISTRAKSLVDTRLKPTP
jgi:RNA polymerase sigma-70 factor (ECF subfamily)